jgi:HPt (histidine-containing phosphotransfer) domain-containing protein
VVKAASIPVLDPGAPARLARLSELAGRDVLGELIALFVVDVPRQIGDCREALGRADADALRRAAHAARGAAGVLGALQLTELCARIELDATAEWPGTLPGLVGALGPAFGRARRALERLATEKA